MTERAKKLLLLYYKQSRKIRRVSGLPPLTFKAKKAGTLKNYRIYGQTVDGESVGDRTGNLFDYKTVTDGYEIIQSQTKPNALWCISDFIPVKPNKQYIGRYVGGAVLGYSSKTSSPVRLSGALNAGVTADSNTFYIRINCAISNKEKVIINEGSTALPYEPYGYKVPVTVSNDTDTLTTPIYLPEPIKMVGDEAEYIDYAEQKMHRIGADDIDVTLPALPVLPGTNTLTVGTEVQPSSVEIKGRIKAAGGD